MPTLSTRAELSWRGSCRNHARRRRFLCNVKIKPEQAKDLEIFSLGGPSDLISVKSLAKGSGNQFQETVVIDRAEYADGSFWQLKDWTFDVSRLVSKPRADSQKV